MGRSVVLAAVFTVCISLLVSSTSCAPDEEYRTTPIIIGHRGNSAQAPENTVPAFEKAMAQGDGFETDLRLTSDGVLVLIHDAVRSPSCVATLVLTTQSVNRTTNGHGLVSNMTFAEIETLDAGRNKGPLVASEPFRYFALPRSHMQRPTLFGKPSQDQAFQMISGTDKVLVMDLKDEKPMGAKVAELLTKYPTISPQRSPIEVSHSQLIASCWTQAQVEDFSKHLNISVKQKLGLAPSEPSEMIAFVRQQADAGVRAFSLRFQGITPAFLYYAHLFLMPVFTWTIDSYEDITAAVQHGVDGIITNNPENAVTFINNINSMEMNCEQDSESLGKTYTPLEMWALGLGVGFGAFMIGLAIPIFIRLKSRKGYEAMEDETGLAARGEPSSYT